MPQPMRSDQRYMPGLDGLRALAVLAVIAFHEQFSWAPGGLLGVGVFFTLSGYLITDLLLGQWRAQGRIHLADFWLRRAKRLLPALFVMLAVVTAWVTLFDRARLASLRGADGAAATYWSNWYLIATHASYFSRFAPPEPLDHLWSLAVEEQFYLIWPWLLLLGLAVIRRRPGAVGWLAVPTLALAGASAIAMMVLYQPGYDPTRIYEGTDTRASGLLIGAALAMVWPSIRAARTQRAGRIALDIPAMAGLGVIVVMVWRVGQYSPFLYRGGLVLLSVATAAVVAAVACPASITGTVLAWRPLRWLGVRSYGVYLWHYPVIVLTTPASGTVSLPRAAAQIAASILIAALSWRYVEDPIRHGAIERLWARLRSLDARRIGWTALAAGASAVGVVVVSCAGLAGAFAAPATRGPATSVLSQSTNSVSRAEHQRTKSRAISALPSRSPAAAAVGPPRTSCRSVVHIGDSTSEGMVSNDYLPRRWQQLPEQYEDVGVQTVYANITGARSVVEVLPGTENGYDAALSMIRRGYHGCWVIALGTNDTADVAAGSQVGLLTRIERMMAATRGQPVMWVNVVSIISTGFYAESNMRRWNDALMQACTRYPNMHVFDWAAMARRPWFISDGIHYTSAGYAIRAHAIAQALARAFPLSGQSSACLIQPTGTLFPARRSRPEPTPGIAAAWRRLAPLAAGSC